MIDAQFIRKSLKDDAWLSDPFPYLSKIASACSESTDIARDLVIRALGSRDALDTGYRNILDELAIKVGLYPYVEALESLSLRSAIAHAAHRADGEMEEFVLHSAQAKVLQRLLDGQSIILSAPTSFGKSLLIDAVISAKDFTNIVLIVPTLALVEETRRRMARFSDRYSIITANSQEIGVSNIFVFTQERFLSLESEMPAIDFFVIDEFYKLSISDDGSRATQLNQAFLKLFKSGAQFYLLGPAISAIPDIVKARTSCHFIIEEFQTVAVELHIVSKKPNKTEALANILDKADGQTLIYCQSPASTRKLLKEYLKIREVAPTQNKELIEAADWTANNYHDKWLVSIALRHGIGIHHGRLPRSLGRFMIRAFEEGKINILLCTSTLIEGVNTAAKNVIVYDSQLNRKPLDFFTFNNIRGRSGRMFRHFLGNVYAFDAPPEPDLPFVDIPAFNPTDGTPSSLLLQMDGTHIPESLKPRVSGIVSQNYLSLEILKKHSGIEPEFLISAAKHIYEVPLASLSELAWSSMPTYENLKATSEIIWDQLQGSTSAKQNAVLSSSMMTFWIWKLYCSRSVPRFRREMIDNQIQKTPKPVDPDDAVENVLAFLRGWASFNYPKYLMAVSDIANEILNKRGYKGCNYAAFATLIEHLFQPSSFASLEEYGLPVEISQRLMDRRVFNKDDNLDAVIRSLRGRELGNYADNVFERRVIEDFQAGLGVKSSK